MDADRYSNMLCRQGLGSLGLHHYMKTSIYKDTNEAEPIVHASFEQLRGHYFVTHAPFSSWICSPG